LSPIQLGHNVSFDGPPLTHVKVLRRKGIKPANLQDPLQMRNLQIRTDTKVNKNKAKCSKTLVIHD